MDFLKDMTQRATKFLKKRQSSKSDVNILLLGESGVGKSTFINSFANYTKYDSLAEAEKNKLLCLVPTRFETVDKNFKDHVIEMGCNENQEQGNSSTQVSTSGARAYTFNHKQGFKIRLIDTPGTRDYKDLNEDRANFAKVISYIARFEYLNAICIFIKHNEGAVKTYSELSLIYLFSRLEKSARSNICFIFTNARSTFFKPDDTILRQVLSKIKNHLMFIEIPCSKQNMFCFDNEGFKYLVASKQGIEFSSNDKEIFSNSFKESEDSCRKLIKYICGDSWSNGLRPYMIQKEILGQSKLPPSH